MPDFPDGIPGADFPRLISRAELRFGSPVRISGSDARAGLDPAEPADDAGPVEHPGHQPGHHDDRDRHRDEWHRDIGVHHRVDDHDDHHDHDSHDDEQRPDVVDPARLSHSSQGHSSQGHPSQGHPSQGRPWGQPLG